MRVAKIAGLDREEYIHEDGRIEYAATRFEHVGGRFEVVPDGFRVTDDRITGAVVCADAREEIASGTAPMQAMHFAGGVLLGHGLFAPEPSETYSLADVLAFRVRWKNADGTQRAWLRSRQRGDSGGRVRFQGDGYEVVPLDDRNGQQQPTN